jgi:phage terminase large subunit-like protein
MSQLLAAEGLTVVEYPQTPQNMAVPTDDLISLLADGRCAHNGCEFLTWQVSNVVGRTGKKGLVTPMKLKREQKIDGPVGIIMALGRASNEQKQAWPEITVL